MTHLTFLSIKSLPLINNEKPAGLEIKLGGILLTLKLNSALVTKLSLVNFRG